jgi:predicted aldo/keto reductase-like oxidoreductase
MEPLRGGKLASLPENATKVLNSLRENTTPVEWAFRFLLNLPNVSMILSGMSTYEQVKENVEIFKEDKPLNETEINALLEVAETLKDSVPCTGCGYCLKDCPKGLNIPFFISIYNELKLQRAITTRMRLDVFPEEKQPTACISCGLCAKNCPQKINVPDEISKLNDILNSMPTWAQICEERNRKMREAK